MNLVGSEGKGESVWLAFFLCEVLAQFAEVARRRGDVAFAAALRRAKRPSSRANIEEHGWDGEWYRRAYFDDGTPLGSARNGECQIDSIAQSWSVLSGVGDAGALARGDGRRRSRISCGATTRSIQLLAPPFDTSAQHPGYIQGYVPGVRENGGQYTHGAIWTVMAFAALGDARARVGAVRHDQSGQPRAHGRRRRDVSRSSRTSSPPTSTRCRRTPAAAAGPGTPARPAGCTG